MSTFPSNAVPARPVLPALPPWILQFNYSFSQVNVIVRTRQSHETRESEDDILGNVVSYIWLTVDLNDIVQQCKTWDEITQHSTHKVKGHGAPYFWGGNVAPAPINTLDFRHLSKLSTTTCLWTWHSRIRPQLVQPGRFPSSPSRLESFAANDRWPREHWSIPADQKVH